jgi:serine/threonine protein kinase
MDNMRSVRPPLPGVLAHRFTVGRILGGGGRATVYLAHDDLLNRDVAIKVFRASADAPDQLRAQEAEANLVASLNHHALTTLFDAGVDASDPGHPQIYLVMEYIVGDDLRVHLLRGPLDATQLCWLGFDLAEGLQFVHENGLLHRDIKPANVLVAGRGATRRVRGKLADFGIASAIGTPEIDGATTGTAAYLSPEQVEGRAATTASDVYSLGLVLLEAISGATAFPGSVFDSALVRLDRDPLIPQWVPAAIAAILRGMTARRPEERTRLEQVATAFQAVLVDMLVAQRSIPLSIPETGTEGLVAPRRCNGLHEAAPTTPGVIRCTAAEERPRPASIGHSSAAAPRHRDLGRGDQPPRLTTAIPRAG